MKNYILRLVVVCVAVCSCNNSVRRNQVLQIRARQNDQVVYSFDGGKTVSRLFVCGENILAFTLQEPFFSLISIEERSALSSFGRKGRSSGELMGIPSGVNFRKGVLQFYDSASKSLVYLSIPDGVVESHPIPYTVSFRPLKMIEVDEIIIATGCFDEGSVAYIDLDQRIITGEDYPFDTGLLTGIMRGTQIQSEIVSAPDNSRFMIRTLASDCFELYEVDKSGIKRVFVNDFKYPPVIEKNRANPGSNKAGYIRSFVDNDYVYLMFSDKYYRDASSEGLLSDIIHVYNWDGFLQQVIHLPESVGAFCVKGTRLFGTIDYPDHTEIVELAIN